jgi:rhomboid protease GluP
MQPSDLDRQPDELHEESELKSKLIKTWIHQPIGNHSFWISFLVFYIVAFASYLGWQANLLKDYQASPQLVFVDQQYWRAWTTLFLHGDMKHLLSNGFFLFILGSFLHSLIGLYVFPLLVFLVGGLVNLVVLQQMPSGVGLIGASGVVYLMGGLWLGLYFLVERTKSWSQRSVRFFGLSLALFMPTEAFDPQVSYAAHYWGFIFGLGCAVVYYFLNYKKIKSFEVFSSV